MRGLNDIAHSAGSIGNYITFATISSAPVEINVYGNKVSFISFGDEAIGTIIESPQIAQAMRELYAMAQIGAETLMERGKTA